jgi:hypothetical protein
MRMVLLEEYSVFSVRTCPISLMRLVESDPALAPLCRELEARSLSIRTPEAVNREVPVQLMTDFDAIDVSRLHPIKQKRFREGPAMYRASDGRVLINAAHFLRIPEGEQLAVLAHEVAHALRDRLGIAGGSNDEHETDLLACRLGCAEELIAHRAHASPGRAEALALWETPASALAALQHWFAMSVAGIVK